MLCIIWYVDAHPSAGLDALADLVTPFAIRVAATLRVADAMAEGVTEPGALAARCGADAGALRRLLRHLSGHGVFEERGDGTFGLGPLGGPLLSTHPMSVRALLDAESFAGRADRSLAELLHSVRTGGPAYERAFGRPYWADVVARPAMAGSLDEGLENMAAFCVRPLTRGYPWAEVRSVVDVGGGSGALLCRLLQACPHLHATLVDLPYSADRAVRRFAEAGIADRVDVVPGSYYDPLPAGADTYLLSHVIDQEPEAGALRVLRRCADAAGPAGAVLLVQTPITAGNRTALTALDLRILATVGGRERTVEEYAELVARAGLRLAGRYPRDGSGMTLFTCRAG